MDHGTTKIKQPAREARGYKIYRMVEGLTAWKVNTL